MLDKRDYRMYKGVKREEIYPQVCEFWSRQGFYVAQTAPFQIQGSSYYQKIGLRREFYLRMDEREGDTYFDLSIRARISDEGAIGGVAAAVIFWPVAVVGGALSYQEYENEANALFFNFWAHVDNITQQHGIYPSAWVPPAPPPASPPPPTPSTPPQTQQQHEPEQQKSVSQTQHPLEKGKKKIEDLEHKKEPSKPPKKLTASEDTEPCKICGALLPQDWKACPYCGKLKSG